ncbi:MAG: magnesium/cobalt transporter CorA [Dehalococcoidia bacterium]|nr:magnesium/cobalt transporter CorA [Dehalococcoidia bacterium]
MSEPEASAISIIYYDKTDYQIVTGASIEDCGACREKSGITWINVDSVTDANLLQSIGSIFNLHELTIQDIANTGHRVKQEDFGSYMLIILKMLEFNKASSSIEAEQLSIVFGKNFLVTFQESPGDFFGDLRAEIKIAGSVVRKMGPDFLACRIIDTIVDNYFNTIESFGDLIEDKQDELMANPTRQTLNSIQGIKKSMMQLRQYVWPVREILSELGKKDSPLIMEKTVAYFRDVYDRIFEAMDLIENTREMVGSLIDIYLSSMSNRTNEVMKVLTVVATIFIPLTFIVGLYGMNFRYMPELNSEWGYPGVLLLMLLVAGGMLLYFHRKKWI